MTGLIRSIPARANCYIEAGIAIRRALDVHGSHKVSGIHLNGSEVMIKSTHADFLEMYCASPTECLRIVELGMPMKSVETLARRMAVPTKWLAATLGLRSASDYGKARSSARLPASESALVLGLFRLIGQVQEMVSESGDPAGFDAATWVGRWLQRSLPALGGRRPAEFMDTADGQSHVSSMVACMQAGVYL